MADLNLALTESKALRDSKLSEYSNDKAFEALNKAKALILAFWKGENLATTEQLAEYYEVSEDVIRDNIRRHKDEFGLDGLKVLRGKELSHARETISLASKTSQAVLWTPRAALRLGMLLRDSEVAKAVRTSLLDTVEKIIPAQAQEIDRLKLELQLAQTQERLMLSTQAIATMHGSQMVALILGKPDAIVTRTEKVETLVTVNDRGRAIAKYDGIGITYLARRFGFGSNTKACRHWLETIGVSESQWLSEPSLIKAQKLPREILPWLDHQYASRQGTRQGLLGE